MILGVRLCLLFAVGISTVILSIYGTFFLPLEFHGIVLERSVVSMLAIAGTSVVLALAPAFPIQILFPASSTRAAVFIGGYPMAGCLVFSLGAADADNFMSRLGMGIVQGLLFWLAIVGGTRLAARLKPFQ